MVFIISSIPSFEVKQRGMELLYNQRSNFIPSKEYVKFNQILNAIKAVELSDEELFLLKSVLKMKKINSVEKKEERLNNLTQKELEVFFLICDGLIPKEIAKKLFIEVSTAQTHRRNIIKKLEIKTFKDWCFYASFSEYKRIAS